jgi:glycosyltransferase involved in cell wall biosynthesis
MDGPSALLIEPYYGGSHKAFIDGLVEHVPGDYRLLTLPARKWKWRMRGSAFHFASELSSSVPGVVPDARYEDGGPLTSVRPPTSAQSASKAPPPSLLFCSSFLSLSDFKSLAPQPYQNLPTIAYFHENQFVYPQRAHQERDYHFGLTNLTTALAADVACFNSRYNLDSFLEAIPAFLARMPDFRPAGIGDQIRAKARVIAPPIDVSPIDLALAHQPEPNPPRPLHIIWNHRWEHDKNPEAFFDAVYALADAGERFRVSVIGESFEDVPAVFAQARERLADRIEHFGYLLHRGDYAKALVEADVVVSTARNEFFGMSVLEACYAGCYPVLPRRLAYPHLFPDEFLYDSQRELVDRLRTLVAAPPVRNAARRIAERYSWPKMAPAYAELLAEVGAGRCTASAAP